MLAMMATTFDLGVNATVNACTRFRVNKNSDGAAWRRGRIRVLVKTQGYFALKKQHSP